MIGSIQLTKQQLISLLSTLLISRKQWIHLPTRNGNHKWWHDRYPRLNYFQTRFARFIVKHREEAEIYRFLWSLIETESVSIVSTSAIGTIFEHSDSCQHVLPYGILPITLWILICAWIESIIGGDDVPHNILSLNSTIIFNLDIIGNNIHSKNQMDTTVQLLWERKRIIDQFMSQGKEVAIASDSQVIIGT